MRAFLPHVPLAACLCLLAACFVSEDALIGEGIRIHDGPVALCLEGSDPCARTSIEGTTYIAAAPDGAVPVRFVLLSEAGGRPVWLGEAEIRDEAGGEPAFVLVVARPDSLSGDGTLNVRVVMPDCDKADEALRARYGLQQAGPYACTAPDLETISAYLIERHGADFANPDWWQAGS